MSEYAYEHDIQRPPPQPVDHEQLQIGRIIELMNQLHVDRTQPPASKLSVQELDIIVFDSRDLKRYTEPCPICYCAFVLDEEGTKMPCKHTYHSDCILPWLSDHNTCPLCRYELPTNDPVYEEKRLERIGKLPKNTTQPRTVSHSYIQDLLQGRIPTEEPQEEEESGEEHEVHRSAPPSGMFS